jgi:hypothetical protein
MSEEEGTRMRHVLVAAPSYDGKVNVWHATALNETSKIGLTKGINVLAVYMSYDALVQRARNDVFKIAVDANVDDLFFIDCDVDWQPADFFKMLEHDVAIVAAPIIKKSDAIHTYSVKLTRELVVQDNGLIEVDGCATGMMRVRADAIQQIWADSKEYREKHKPEPSRMVFDVKVVDGEIWSEDIVFCDKWIKMGGKIYIDPSVNCGHSGEKRWISCFGDFIKDYKSPAETIY